MRDLREALDELDEPAPDATYTCGDATYGDDEEKCVGAEAAFQPLQIPIKALLFSIVHGKDVPAAAGDFELSVRDNALDSMMFLHTSPAPALILDEQACVVMWSVGMERVLGAGAPLRHGMPLAELPFSTSVDADHALCDSPIANWLWIYGAFGIFLGALAVYTRITQLSIQPVLEAAKALPPESPEAQHYCCPTPPITPAQCSAGPVVKTKFVQAVHQLWCIHVRA